MTMWLVDNCSCYQYGLLTGYNGVFITRRNATQPYVYKYDKKNC